MQTISFQTFRFSRYQRILPFFLISRYSFRYRRQPADLITSSGGFREIVTGGATQDETRLRIGEHVLPFGEPGHDPGRGSPQKKSCRVRKNGQNCRILAQRFFLRMRARARAAAAGSMALPLRTSSRTAELSLRLAGAARR